ncbi:3-hydroxyacyl-ACP dehydratase FabZ [Fusibacter tunisiensis]|uniref:3-hydroxyacyl-[acyl-carrier-protein] dehydratase FabZ n=1 Tax=Fusibacter tunisiensis TaxID=1008308 RepID=A0ABS2MRJ3_9FIRM|nr:3-hydroxyacyl-ACP dehydratase FabZ [Fusibacter tunisiensis]MBM7562008.1 3-hydroxyacyl-[acyl-carrier-protein] dehydratase [Fusibacter tunisiensis]
MIDSNTIQKILPHRYPFVLVDRITDIENETTIVGIKNVTINEPFFQGHFPTEHVMPGVLIIEALAQTGAILLLKKEENSGKIAYFAGVDKCKFRRKVIPGDSLQLRVELIKHRHNFGVAKGYAKVNDEIVCEAELSFYINS